MHVIKASGDRVEFNPEKLRRSLLRAGAGRDRADAILRAVLLHVREDMATKEIYRLAHRMLRREARPAAARYALKQALLGLGPSGYPFERFIAKLLEADGLAVETGVLRNGRCVQHELDIFGLSSNRVLLGECKFHHRQHLVCDVKVPLYIHSRFRDLQDGFLKEQDSGAATVEGWIFTNTRFTDDALQYGRCAGLHLVGWDTPFDNGLRNWVDRTGLHPLTCLTTLTQQEKDLLLRQNIVLTRELMTDSKLLSGVAGVAPGRVKGILEEAGQVCYMTNRPADLDAES